MSGQNVVNLLHPNNLDIFLTRKFSQDGNHNNDNGMYGAYDFNGLLKSGNSEVTVLEPMGQFEINVTSSLFCRASRLSSGQESLETTGGGRRR